MADDDVECMFAWAEGNSRNHKLDEVWCSRRHSWNALWDRPQVDDEMPGGVEHSSAKDQIGARAVLASRGVGATCSNSHGATGLNGAR